MNINSYVPAYNQVYQGSLYQQALLAEARRVLSQPYNRRLKLKLTEDVAAVGMGRNSIGAIITASRPYKKVFLVYHLLVQYDSTVVDGPQHCTSKTTLNGLSVNTDVLSSNQATRVQQRTSQ